MRTFGAMALQASVHNWGFFGISGLFGFLIGLICLIVVCVILWKILEIILPKLGLDAGWLQVIKLLCILLIFLIFLHFFGVY
jgi:hypothetical protein